MGVSSDWWCFGGEDQSWVRILELEFSRRRLSDCPLQWLHSSCRALASSDSLADKLYSSIHTLQLELELASQLGKLCSL